MSLRRQKLLNLQKYLYIECDNPARLSCDVEYSLAGWYSLDDDGVFRKGRRPTCCRIRVHGPGRSRVVFNSSAGSLKGR